MDELPAGTVELPQGERSPMNRSTSRRILALLTCAALLVGWLIYTDPLGPVGEVSAMPGISGRSGALGGVGAFVDLVAGYVKEDQSVGIQGQPAFLTLRIDDVSATCVKEFEGYSEQQREAYYIRATAFLIFTLHDKERYLQRGRGYELRFDAVAANGTVIASRDTTFDAGQGIGSHHQAIASIGPLTRSAANQVEEVRAYWTYR